MADADDREFENAFSEACEIFAIEQEIADLEKMATQTPSEFILRRDELAKLRSKSKDLNAVFARRGKKEPNTLVAELRANGKTDWEIAGTLKAEYNLSSHQIGTLLPAKPGSHIDQKSVSRRGRALLQKREKNIGSKNPKKIR